MVAGSDSNAGIFIGFNSIFNGGFGINDRCLLENVYTGIHTQDNQGGMSFWIEGTVSHSYSEGEQGPSYARTMLGGSGFGSGGWDANIQAYRPTWTGTTTYAVNSYVKPSVDNGWYYKTALGGTSAGSEPNPWPKGKGLTVTDGTITWTCHGVYIPNSAGGAQLNASETTNLIVKHQGNPDDVRLYLGSMPSGGVTNQIFYYQYFLPTGFGRDTWTLSYDKNASQWHMLINLTDELWAHYDRGNSRALDHRTF
jgi:hypothetical protein